MSELAEDVLATADALEIERFSYVGLSLGGGIGQSLALDHPHRLAALVLCCTAAKFGNADDWRERSARVTAEGVGFLVETNRDRWFTAALQAEHPDVVNDVLAMLAATSPVGYAACCDALAEFDATDRLAEITTPTRVIAGADDPVTTPEVCRRLSDGINGADLVVIDDAAHIANLAQPKQFAAAVKDHLERHP
jgi:3-oxoadipate enol-lactonase